MDFSNHELCPPPLYDISTNTFQLLPSLKGSPAHTHVPDVVADAPDQGVLLMREAPELADEGFHGLAPRLDFHPVNQKLLPFSRGSWWKNPEVGDGIEDDGDLGRRLGEEGLGRWGIVEEMRSQA